MNAFYGYADRRPSYPAPFGAFADPRRVPPGFNQGSAGMPYRMEQQQAGGLDALAAGPGFQNPFGSQQQSMYGQPAGTPLQWSQLPAMPYSGEQGPYQQPNMQGQLRILQDMVRRRLSQQQFGAPSFEPSFRDRMRASSSPPFRAAGQGPLLGNPPNLFAAPRHY